MGTRARIVFFFCGIGSASTQTRSNSNRLVCFQFSISFERRIICFVRIFIYSLCRCAMQCNAMQYICTDSVWIMNLISSYISRVIIFNKQKCCCFLPISLKNQPTNQLLILYAFNCFRNRHTTVHVSVCVSVYIRVFFIVTK